MRRTLLIAVDDNERRRTLVDVIKMARPGITIDVSGQGREQIMLQLHARRYAAVVIPDTMDYASMFIDDVRADRRCGPIKIIVWQTRQESLHAAPDVLLASPLTLQSIRQALQSIC